MFSKRLCDQWECKADEAIAELEKQQGRSLSEKEKAVFRKRGHQPASAVEAPSNQRW